MQPIFGLLMCVAGIALGVYMGVWWAFIGGIVDVIQEVRADQLDAMNVAIGVAKVVFAGFIGWISAIVLIIPGVSLTK